MPPKVQVHKNSKSTLPRLIVQDDQASSGTSRISPEAEQQFEIELCWCIQQLQMALGSGKLNRKQVQDHTKSLNTLMNNSAPIVKKRQVMRLSFGDYRAKMVEDAKKTGNVTLKVKPGTPSKKSMFVKKSTCSLATGNTFKFNFDAPNDTEDADNVMEHLPVNEKKDINRAPHYVPSDNSFRFSFSIQEET